LREETGLDVRPARLIRVRTARGWLAEFVLLAECSGEPRAISAEIMDARFWDPKELPGNLLEAHRELIEGRLGDWGGMPLE
jgi:ADP-ribose pyrophosphatase YjhB (NUDIX family)